MITSLIKLPAGKHLSYTLSYTSVALMLTYDSQFGIRDYSESQINW